VEQESWAFGISFYCNSNMYGMQYNISSEEILYWAGSSQIIIPTHAALDMVVVAPWAHLWVVLRVQPHPQMNALLL